MKWKAKVFLFISLIILLASMIQISSIPMTHAHIRGNATRLVESKLINVTDLKEEQKKLQIEEDILQQKKNDISELLKINISNIDFTKEEDFETSYNTLKLINESFRHLKNISGHTIGSNNTSPVIAHNIVSNTGKGFNTTSNNQTLTEYLKDSIGSISSVGSIGSASKIVHKTTTSNLKFDKLTLNITNSTVPFGEKDLVSSKLVNISISLIVIGLLMGVLLGLILVMYVNTKKEIKN